MVLSAVFGSAAIGLLSQHVGGYHGEGELQEVHRHHESTGESERNRVPLVWRDRIESV